MKYEPTDEVELLYALLTGPYNWSDVDDVRSRADPGVGLKFEVPDGDGVVYVQCKPFAVQAYDGSPMDSGVEMFEGTWDELADLWDTPLHPNADEDGLREYVEARKQ